MGVRTDHIHVTPNFVSLPTVENHMRQSCQGPALVHAISYICREWDEWMIWWEDGGRNAEVWVTTCNS